MIRALLVACLLIVTAGARAAEAPPALTGHVTSAAEGEMEGVLVTASRPDSTISVTVVSDAHGIYRFPAGRLASGTWFLDIRAVGYEIDGRVSGKVATGETADVDIALVPAHDLAAQLTNTEWLMSMPGTDNQKKTLLECMSCHTLERIVRSTHNSDEFIPVLTRMMNYANNSTTLHPQKRLAQRTPKPELLRRAVDYLATINLSNGAPWAYPLKTLRRPTGEATRAIVTTYALPRPTIAPHDVRVDKAGMIWFSEFGDQNLGMLDPRTGTVVEYPFPTRKPGSPTGALDLEADANGHYWLAMMFQAGLAEFDPKTKKFRLWPIPKALDDETTQQSMVMPASARVDGKVWSNMVAQQSVIRLDLKTGAIETIDPFKNMPTGHEHAPYGMTVDARNNLYFMDFGDQNIGRVDAKTGVATIYPTPTGGSRPRRGMMDDQGRLWFAEFAANQLGMFDTKHESFREFALPTPWTAPYDASIDKDGMLWSGGMNSDRVQRLDPATGAAIEYLLPAPTNIRRILIDNTTPTPTFWAGNNHHATIYKLEIVP